MYRQFQSGALLALAAAALVTGTATAQEFKSDRRVRAANGIGGLQLPGTGLPEYPPAGARYHKGVLYVEATQADDVIRIGDAKSAIEVQIYNFQTGLIDFEEYVETPDLSLIVVYGLAGDDLLMTSTYYPVVYIGGLGDDDWID